MAAEEKQVIEWKHYIGLSAKLAGSFLGLGATMATGDPVKGIVLKEVVAHMLDRGGAEMINRVLAPRQKIRVVRAVTVACIKLQEHQRRGEKPREDGFFEAGDDGQAVADEVTEAALQAAMNSAQERKVDFIGALLANIAVNREIDVSTAHLLIELAQSLSYRSFVLLKIVGDIDAFGFSERLGEDAPGAPPELRPLLVEVYALSRQGLVELRDKADTANTYAVLGSDDIDPARVRLSTVGRLLHDNLELRYLDTSDPVYVQTVDQLSQLSRTGQGVTVMSGGGF